MATDIRFVVPTAVAGNQAGGSGVDMFATFDLGGTEIANTPTERDITRTVDTALFFQNSSGKSFAPSWGYVEIDTTKGAVGTSRSLKATVTGGRTNPYQTPAETAGSDLDTKQEAIDNPSWWFKNDNRAVGITGARGMNRISFYAMLPTNHVIERHHSGEPENYTMHFGTYTRDIDGSWHSGSSPGNHYYHWLNFTGTGNSWTKVIIDEHPQHEVGVSGVDPGDNPTLPSHNYLEGFTRFYFKTKTYHDICPWSMWYDELRMYNDARPMPPKVATICLTPISDSEFEICFASVDEGGGAGFFHTYEVKYSYSPIDGTNYYTTAITCSGSPTVSGDWERYCQLRSTGMDNAGKSIVYFAIRQTDENDTDIAFAEYEYSYT